MGIARQVTDPEARPDRNTSMPSIGPMEIIIVLIIALVVLGPKRLPDAGRSLGSSVRGFKDALTGGGDDDEKVASRLPAATRGEQSA
jgi:sec-independent protein translocase protein TatA